MTPPATPPLDPAKLERFSLQFVNDIGTAMLGGLSYIGERLGIFRKMAAVGPVTPAELAEHTGLSARYLREWLQAMAAARYVTYQHDGGKYSLPPEHGVILADETSPLFLGGYIQLMLPAVMMTHKVMEGFRSGLGVPQSEYPLEFFAAMERVTGPRYRGKLIPMYMPALPRVVAKLQAGGRAMDVGCGSGRAAITLATAYPKAEVWGVDNHPESVELARGNARREGVEANCKFEVMDAAKGLPPGKFDFITTFDTVHDAADPVGMMRAIHAALADDGTYLIVEAGCCAHQPDNMNPVGKFVYCLSTLYCLSQSLAAGGPGIGTGITEPIIRELAASAGFSYVKKIPVKEPVSVLYEIRK